MSVTGRPLQKGWIGRIRDGELDPEAYLVFQYNPTPTKENVAPSYSMVDPPGSAFPTAIFKSVTSQDISFRLLIDAVENYSPAAEGILSQKAFFEGLARQDLDPFVEGLGSFVSPPAVLLGIGPESWYTVVTSLGINIVRRNRELVPTRAWVDLTFQVIHKSTASSVAYYSQLSDRRVITESAGY